MADPHTVPLPASRGSLDQPRPDFHHPHHSTLADVDEADSSADAAWFDDGTAPQDDDEPPAPPPDEPEPEDDAPPRPAAAGESGVDNGEPAAEGQDAGAAAEGADGERIQLLEDELDRTRQDRDAWEAQYQGLLAKLTAMRNTLGDKLKQDAVRPFLLSLWTVPAVPELTLRRHPCRTSSTAASRRLPTCAPPTTTSARRSTRSRAS